MVQEMDALILNRPRELGVERRERPEPGPGEVLVRIRHGGICGSDLHYFLHGGFGKVRMRGAMILGHELAGTVAALGPGSAGLEVGDRVAVNPSLPCGVCDYCSSGAPRHCRDMRFMGSAMRQPPIEGGFREYVTCGAEQAIRVPGGVDLAEAALAEPLAVCLHAVAEAGEVAGRRILVTGCGPIGALCLLAAKEAGAARVEVTDVAPAPLALARQLGADAVHDVTAPGPLAAEAQDCGTFDVVFECAGHPAAVAQALEVTRPKGTIVQVGMLPDEVSLALNALVTKEIAYRGTFRFDAEFARAVDLIGRRAVDVRPLISARFPLAEAEKGFKLAMDRTRAVKVILDI